ncbi:tail fiber domain-containing protein [Burkholderia cepacia]|uniref:tail fiber domain-containing protein n=1 Tax=Burkholderia cepacia TaxID=292 RepID=UPI002654328F|nr:tail fiber domain-containing protein [Burkholderia cepacia]MDN7897203.1 tail fiber domain-containing protein [Burkholderia cepacia]
MRHFFEQPDLPLRAFHKALGKNRPATLEGGGKGGDAPSAPDPWTVAQATTASNNAAAQFNKALNLNNYSNPFGSQQSTQVGTDPATGAPIYNTNISASGPLQGLINSAMNSAGGAQGQLNNALFGLGGVNSGLQSLGGQYQGLNGSLGALAPQFSGLNSQLASIGGSIDPQAAQQAGAAGQNAAYAAQTQYLDPRFSQGQTSLESQLANQGLTPGSQAYDNAMKNFNLSKNQAYSDAANQSILTGQQIGSQMLQNQLATANTRAGLVGQQGQNLGAQAGLLGQQGSNLGAQAGLLGQQGTNYGQMASLGQLPFSQLATLAGLVPGNTGTAQAATSPANIAQAMQNQYAGQMNQYNTQTASANSTMGGLFGLGGAGLMALALSDRRTKTDIEAIGPAGDGMTYYRFRYRTDPPGTVRHGLMADEVKRVRPDAVVRHPSGFDLVNYDRALEG